MTPSKLRSELECLGMSNKQLAEALKLGKGGDRTVRRWLSGERAIRGHMEVAIELVLKEHKDNGRRSTENAANPPGPATHRSRD